MILNAIFIGLALSADSFSAALAMGFRKHQRKDAVKFALSSGGAEALVAFMGAIAGKTILTKFGDYDHWIAFGLLLAVALHILKDGIQGLKGEKEEEHDMPSFHGFHKILLVSFATSLDALGVGVGLGVLKDPLAPYIVSIGLWAFFSTLAGLFLASRVPKRFGPYSNFLGAIILCLLAVKMLDI